MTVYIIGICRFRKCDQLWRVKTYKGGQLHSLYCITYWSLRKRWSPIFNNETLNVVSEKKNSLHIPRWISRLLLQKFLFLQFATIVCLHLQIRKPIPHVTYFFTYLWAHGKQWLRKYVHSSEIHLLCNFLSQEKSSHTANLKVQFYFFVFGSIIIPQEVIFYGTFASVELHARIN